MIKHLFKYLLIVLLAGGFTACSEDEGAQILGGLYEKVDIAPEPGMNLVGRVTDGKNPIEGAVVSDGFTVTTTDAQGVYQMRVKKSTPFVFVSVPADCEIPVENGMPKIYKKIALGDNDVVQRSFTLERTGKKERFTLLALADVQIGRDNEVVMLEKEVLPLLVPYVQQLDKPVYGISLGDLVWDNMPFHSVYKEQIRKIGVPVFQVIGNHDHDRNKYTDREATENYRNHFGPTYYAFDMGRTHYIVLDDIVYHGAKKYDEQIDSLQLAWAAEYARRLPAGSRVCVAMHAPAMKAWKGNQVMESAARLMDAFAEGLGDYDKTHKVLILTTQVTYEGSDVGIYEVGKRVKNRFRFLEAHDMTIEAVVTKIMWLLAQDCDSFDQLQQRFYRQVNFDTFYH